MIQRILARLQDEQGIETLEWIVVGALIVAVAIVVYPGTLQTQLTGALTSIGATITGIASS